jgi:DNA replication protein DnaC
MPASTKKNTESIDVLLRALKLPGFGAHHEEMAVRAEKNGWSFDQYLRELCETELDERRQRRISRLLKLAELPPNKTLATLDLARLPIKVRRQVPTLCEGGFVERAENLLAFGLPGRGKTHLLAAIGYELVSRGYKLLCRSAYALVQQLLVAKRDLSLEKAMRRLDTFDVVLIDDIGYIQQDREEMEVLFTFLAERYERRSVMITSNLVFSQWDRIFKDAMTTACAIDRVVHHSIILELTGPSVRGEEAKQRNAAAVAAADEITKS